MSANSTYVSLSPEQTSDDFKNDEYLQARKNGSSSNVSRARQSKITEPKTLAFEHPPNYKTIVSKFKQHSAVTSHKKSRPAESSPASTLDAETQPLLERGLHLDNLSESRWPGLLVCIGAWFALLAPSGIMNTFGTFQAYIGRNQLQSESDGKISWIFALYAYLFMLGTVFAGK